MKKKTIYLLLAFNLLFNFCNGQSIDKAPLPKLALTEELEAVKMIKDFYVSYTTNLLNDRDAVNDALVRRCLTEALIAKVKRMTSATDADPIIRAQDFSQEAVRSLRVKHLDGNWYMVSYALPCGDEEFTYIPLRVIKLDGRYKIDYITPEWNNVMYGDSLLFKHHIHQSVDASTPLSFLKTFYEAYTMEYCSMPADLARRLKTLRAKYCTSSALAQFQAASIKNKIDCCPGYDLLIDYFDFDRLWIRSMTYTHLGKDIYQMHYTKWPNSVTTVTLRVIKQGGKYWIDKISCTNQLSG